MDMLKLESQLCFPLYAAAREVVKQYTPFLSELGLTYTQYITMMVLWEHKQLDAKTLGARLHLDSGTLTPLLKRLENLGYVTRERAAADERKLLVTLTDSGAALRERAVSIPERMSACLRLTAAEGAELYRLLYKILDAL